LEEQVAGRRLGKASGQVGETAPVAGDDPLLLGGEIDQAVAGYLALSERAQERMVAYGALRRRQLGSQIGKQARGRRVGSSVGDLDPAFPVSRRIGPPIATTAPRAFVDPRGREAGGPGSRRTSLRCSALVH